ncbi:MAG: hypothetical protein KJ832_24105, partial [Gammaproteobacteria bacterium]|nr:hypothetical protein [Gammaproteobacteria bacterium]
GVQVLREPVAAADLSRLLEALPSTAGPARTGSLPDEPAAPLHVAPRRFSDETLGALAASPSSIACECLRHVVELVTQLGAFERYSADCVSVGPADAALHRDLSRTAGASRTLFEEALARMMDEHPVTNAPESAPRSRKG